jgi:hypothetical protein
MSLNFRERQSLDRYITGNYGEDQFKGEEEEMEKLTGAHGIECVEHILSLLPKSNNIEAIGAANELFLHFEDMKRQEAKAANAKP